MIYMLYLDRVLFNNDINKLISKNFNVHPEQIGIRNTYEFLDSDPKEIEVYVGKISGDFKIYLEISAEGEPIKENVLAKKTSKLFSCKCLFTDDLENGFTWFMYDENQKLRHVSIVEDLNIKDETNFTIDYYMDD